MFLMIQKRHLIGAASVLMMIFFTAFPLTPQQKLSFLKNPPVKRQLSNGLPVIYQQDDSSNVTVLHVIVRGGKGVEPAGKRGLAHLTTRLMLELPYRSKVQDLMKLASKTSMLCKIDYSRINIACLSINLDETLKIASEIIRKPLISSLRINQIKKQMDYQREAEEDDPINVGHLSHLENLFGKTAYGGSVLGSKQSLKKITKKDVENFYKAYFNAANMTIVVSTDLEEKALMEIIEEYFGKIPSGQPMESPQRDFPVPETKKTSIKKDTKQTLVSVSYLLQKLTRRDFTLAFMTDILLGKGIHSRLWPLRAKEKLAYNVNSTMDYMIDGGILEAYLETDSEKRERAMEALSHILNDLYDNGITAQELEVTKINVRSHFLRGNETKEIRVQNLDFFEATGLGYEFINTFLQEVESITVEEINRYLKNVLNPERAIFVTVGPEEKSEKNKD
jgi:zinc protease